MTRSQAIVFFLVLAAGIGLSLFTLNRCDHFEQRVAGEREAEKDAAEQGEGAEEVRAGKPDAGEGEPSDDGKTAARSGEVGSAAEKGMTAKTGAVEAEAKAEGEATDKAASVSPEALMASLADAIAKGDLSAVFAGLGEDKLPVPVKAELEKWLKGSEVRLDPDAGIVQLARSADVNRWVLKLQVKGENGEWELREIYADLKENPDGGWELVAVQLPGLAPDGSGGMTIGYTDALGVAHALVKRAMLRDYKGVRELTHPDKLSDEKVAALLIALEDGDFALIADRPLVVSLSRDDMTWVIARVASDSQKSEFAIELSRQEELGWVVDGLTFSKLIAATAMAGGAGDEPYAPVKENPQGGDSLVLYFDFDTEELGVRARRQLEIIADILRKDPLKKITIDGHTDSLGDETYNVELSVARARAVRNALIDLGVQAEQVVTQGFGEQKPISPNETDGGRDNPSGRAQNRRAEVYLDF